MEKRSVILFAFVILFIGFASAKITISDVNPIYNLGDKIFITINLVPASLDGNFEINLNCQNNSANMYKVPAEASFALGEEQKVSTFVVLSEATGSGTCYLEASLGNEKMQTKTFTISDSILLNVKLDKLEYNPGETITLDMEATKANGQLLEGFLEVSGAAQFTKAISKGQLIEKFALPESTAAGTYTLNLYAYDKKGEQILNEANATASLKINQVAKSLIMSIDKTEVMPADNITIGAELLDQAGTDMVSNVSYTLISPNNEETSILGQIGENRNINFDYNSTPGKWKIFASSLGINDQKEFTVKEIQKVSFEFLNGTSVLLVKNIGNSVYNKNIGVVIGNQTQNLSLLNIGIGEERKFTLNAPDGEYQVVISDNDSKFEQKMFLTGKAISVGNFKGVGLLSRYPLLWVFLAVILAGAAGVAGIRYFRKKTFKHDSALDSEKIFPTSKKASEMESKDSGFVNVSSKVNEAEASGVVKGNRTVSAIVAIKFGSLTENSRPEVERLLASARVKKGVVERSSNHVVVIFAPQVTKSRANEWIAAKFAYDMSRELSGYNKRSADKISFGIGIHAGDLIGSVEGGKFKYTGVGGTILLAKRISDTANGRVLISDDARRKIMKDLRGQKTGEVGKATVFEITGIADREANQGKLDDLMKRMGK